MDVLLVEFLAERLKLLVLDLHLLSQVVDDLLQLSTFHGTFTHLLLQLVDELLVLLHSRLDELQVLRDALLSVGTFTRLGECHTVLCLGNLAESLLNVTECGHHVVDLIVFLCNNLLQRITLLQGSLLGLLHSILITTCYRHCAGSKE